jgi:hypothetical protein
MQQTTSCPKWGSSVQQKKLVVEIDINHAWGPATKDEVTANNKMLSITKKDELRSLMYLTTKEKSSFLHHQKDRRWYMNLLATETWELEVWL